jgi:sporulation protein YlmC with PRC-barrel domain
MKRPLFVSTVLIALMSAAAAQTAPTVSSPATIDTMPKAGEWRASKLIGLNVYNDQNEKLGDINELIVETSGKIIGYVIGVGGFLGLGEHSIIVEPAKLKFVNEPIRTTSTGSPPTTNAPSGPSMDSRNVSNTTAGSAGDRANPDHAVLSATKDGLKAMPRFKY